MPAVATVTAVENNCTGSTNNRTVPPNQCAGCGKSITDRYLLRALDLLWHEDCLKCGCCNCRLGEVGASLFTKANLILCKRDYLRLFGSTGYCAACNKVIPAFEMVMRAKTNVYHLECFACQQCNHRFCVGDKFYLCDNKILCEYDYEERMVFASLAFNPSAIAQIKRSSAQMTCPVTSVSGPTSAHSPQQGQSMMSLTCVDAPGLVQTPSTFSQSATASPQRHLSTTSNYAVTNVSAMAAPLCCVPTEPVTLRGGYGSPGSPMAEK